jgi:hypothetical protein
MQVASIVGTTARRHLPCDICVLIREALVAHRSVRRSIDPRAELAPLGYFLACIFYVGRLLLALQSDGSLIRRFLAPVLQPCER